MPSWAWRSPACKFTSELKPRRCLGGFSVPGCTCNGPVVVTIEYLIDQQRSDDFLALMQESRRSRLRQGALGWELLRDIGKPGRYIEQIIDETWTEHLRRFDRVTASDVALRERKLAFHQGEDPPLVTRCLVEPPGRS